jgi:hypothetical protein
MNNSTSVIISGSTFLRQNRLALPEIFIICVVLSLKEGQWVSSSYFSYPAVIPEKMHARFKFFNVGQPIAAQYNGSP